jgi:hypothetical protein
MKLARAREMDRQRTRIWISAGAALFLVVALALVGVVSSDKHAADPHAADPGAQQACTVPKLVTWPVSWGFVVGSGCSAVFVDRA